MRILITVSRSWKDWDTVRRAYDEATAAHPNEVITVVHGNNPDGDREAARIATVRGCVTEGHDANWSAYGNAAGPIRNQEMVNAHADVCLAFIRPCRKAGCRKPKPHDSHGASDCVSKARAAGISVWTYRSGDDE